MKNTLQCKIRSKSFQDIVYQFLAKCCFVNLFFYIFVYYIVVWSLYNVIVGGLQTSTKPSNLNSLQNG